MALLHDVDVRSPRSVQEALRILHARREDVRVVAGGTDLIIQMKNGAAPTKDLLNIFGLDELRYVKLRDRVLRIGAMTLFAELADHPLVRKHAKVLAEAAAMIGSVQIMNKASFGGNVVNASPAADSVPALYALHATLVVRSAQGAREIPVERFYRGYKKLDLRPDELLTEIRMPAMRATDDGIFLRHGLRLGNACALVNVAIWVRRKAWMFADARVALGAVAPIVVRARKCEGLITGRELDETSIIEAARAVVDAVAPIDDVRASAAYRREMSAHLVYMGLWELLNHGR